MKVQVNITEANAKELHHALSSLASPRQRAAVVRRLAETALVLNIAQSPALATVATRSPAAATEPITTDKIVADRAAPKVLNGARPEPIGSTLRESGLSWD
jgi:hypothetical protein